MHKPGSGYDDQPEDRYHFPAQYKGRLDTFVGDWILYYQPGVKHYKAVARVERIDPDPLKRSHYYARIAPGSYCPFEVLVPHRRNGVIRNRLLEGPDGTSNSHLVRAAVQPIVEEDFFSILDEGLPDQPNVPEALPREEVREVQTPFAGPQPAPRQRVETRLNRLVRDRAFRVGVLAAYGSRCAFTGLGFRNGGGRAEVQAAHIVPVERGGTDSVNNGLALSGTVHWMFDRGLLSLKDDGEILVSRKVNDIDSVSRLIGPDRCARRPESPSHYPHPDYLAWHREEVFER